jgi:hypothetical protein
MTGSMVRHGSNLAVEIAVVRGTICGRSLESGGGDDSVDAREKLDLGLPGRT